MPRISRLERVNPIKRYTRDMLANSTPKSSQARKLRKMAFNQTQLREMSSAQKLEVTKGMAQAEKGASLDMLGYTLYIVCW